MKKNIILAVFIVAVGFIGGVSIVNAQATTVVKYNVAYDNALNSKSPDFVRSSSNYISIGHGATYGPETMRYIGKLNLSAVDKTRSIQKAVIKIDRVSSSFDNDSIGYGIFYSLHRVDSSWDNSTVTFNNSPSIGTSIISQGVKGNYGVFEFDVTELVKGWVNGTIANYGFLIKKGGDINMTDNVYGVFASSNYPSNGAETRPYLEITYNKPAPPLSIKVLSPNGGETLTVGGYNTITWDSSKNIDKVSIGWSLGAGSLNWIATNIPNRGSYLWTVGVGNFAGGSRDIKIYIIGYETGVDSISDYSDNFLTVEKPRTPVKIISPNGGDVWEVGKTYQIKWDASGYSPTSKVSIGLRDSRYSPNLSSGENTIARNIPNTGSYNFAVPTSMGTLSEGALGGDSVYTIVVYVDGGGAVSKFDESDAPFSIVKESTSVSTITSIGVKDSYTLGNDMYISWTPALPGVSTISLVPLDGHVTSYGVYGMKVFGNPVNTTGNYTYKLPEFTSIMKPGEYYLKLTPVDGSPDIISGVFTIQNKTVTIPNSNSILGSNPTVHTFTAGMAFTVTAPNTKRINDLKTQARSLITTTSNLQAQLSKCTTKLKDESNDVIATAKQVLSKTSPTEEELIVQINAIIANIKELQLSVGEWCDKDPIIYYFSPTLSPAGSKFIIYGKNLSNIVRVTLSSAWNTDTEFYLPGRKAGSYKIDFSPVSDTKIQAFLPKDLFRGDYHVSVADKAHSTQAKDKITVTNSTSPTISYLIPTTVTPGGTVIVHGSKFNKNSRIVLDGGYRTIIPYLKTNTSLSFIVPSDIKTGSHFIRIGFGGMSLGNRASFTVVSPNLTPKSAPIQVPTLPQHPTITPSVFIPTPHKIFTRNMWKGLRGNDVKKLQKLFNSTDEFKLTDTGLGSPERETTYYGFLLRSAVQNFQCKYGIVCSGSQDGNGYGVVGPKTRAKIQDVFGSGDTSVESNETGATSTPKTQKPATRTVSSKLQQQIQQMMKQLELMQKQLKAMQSAMVVGAFDR